MIWQLLHALNAPTEWAIKFEKGEITLAPLNEVKERVIERQLVK